MEVLVNNPADLNTIYSEFNAHILPTGLLAPGVKPPTRVWGYRRGSAPTLADTYLGPVIVAQRSDATRIRWWNALPGTADSNVTAWTTSTDRTLHWADPLDEGMQTTNYAGPIPAVVHLHGGEVPPQLDGGPDAWYANDGTTQYQGHGYHTFGYTGGDAPGNYADYYYPNTQEAANIRFHDHALGITRLNVYAGMAGGYILYDSTNAPPDDLGGVPGASKRGSTEK